MEAIKEWLYTNSAPIFGSILGGVIGKEGNFWQRLGSIVAGAILAILTTPFIAYKMGITPMDTYYSGVASLVGMFGLNISKKIFAADLGAILRALILKK